MKTVKFKRQFTAAIEGGARTRKFKRDEVDDIPDALADSAIKVGAAEEVGAPVKDVTEPKAETKPKATKKKAKKKSKKKADENKSLAPGEDK